VARYDHNESQLLLWALKRELAFFDAGGYGQPFRSEWRPTLLLRDSPACLNYNATGRQIPCRQCPFFSLVPPDSQDALVPCHHIPLDTRGHTVGRLYRTATQKELDQHYHNWLCALIREIESSVELESSLKEIFYASPANCK
jgi:hypothetical protein